MLTYGNFFWNAAGSALNLGLHNDDCWLACMPLFHVGGLSILLRGAIYGMTVEVHDGFDPVSVNQALGSGRVTIVSLVATMLRRLLDRQAGGYHPNLRCVLLGGGPVPPDLLQECLRRGIPVAQTYGLTEAASQVSTLLPAEAVARPGSAGQPLLPVEVRIEGESGATCAPGAPGEIVIRGPTVASGYYKRPATDAAFSDGWFHTGDFAYADADGYLYIVDRRDDVIVSGGENVYPAEVEGVLGAHGDVVDAGVFALEDAVWGQRVAAVVSLLPGSHASAAALEALCRERLAAYKAPKAFYCLGELPRNASGKLLRRELRRLAQDGALRPLD
jgi:O-succinylbenzoic acid--CoA ligase